jgi:hypothetical protein
MTEPRALSAEAHRLHAEWGHLRPELARRCEEAAGRLYADEPDPCRYYVGLATLDAARRPPDVEALAIINDCIYGLRNQPEISREDIANILARLTAKDADR